MSDQINFDDKNTFANLNIEDTIQRLRDLRARSIDVVAPLDNLRMLDTGEFVLQGGGDVEPFLLKANSTAIRQVAEKHSIPWRYFERCVKEDPKNAADQFNRWNQFERQEKGGKIRKNFARIYSDAAGGNTGTLRGLLSDSFGAYDNLELLGRVLKTCNYIHQTRGLTFKVEKCDLSEQKLYLRFTCPDLSQGTEALRDYKDPNGGHYGGVGRDNGVVSAFVISNSEVGHGRLTLVPMLRIHACSNKMIWQEEAFYRSHLGTKMTDGIYHRDTHRTNWQLIEKQVRDNLLHWLTPDYLGKKVSEIEAMHEAKLANPINCTRLMSKEIGLSDTDTDEILNKFALQGIGDSVFAVAQAMTAYAHTCDPDKQYEIERKSTTLMKLVKKCDKPAEKPSDN